jgi:hypothetical protein
MLTITDLGRNEGLSRSSMGKITGAALSKGEAVSILATAAAFFKAARYTDASSECVKGAFAIIDSGPTVTLI